MNISILGSNHASSAIHHASEALRGSRRSESTTPEAAGGADARHSHIRQGLAKALADALADLMSDAGSGASASAEGVVDTASSAPAGRGDQAKDLHDFRHELFQAFRPTAGEDGPGRHGRGFAWGRATLGDIAQRLETLAQTLGAAANTATPPADSAPAAESASVLGAEPAPMPTAEPSALLTVFQALSGPSGGASAATDGANALAALLTRIAQALRGDSAVMAPATGALVDVTA